MVNHLELQSQTKLAREQVFETSRGNTKKGLHFVSILLILLILGAFTVAWRYIARARGDLDAYVLSGILVGVFMVARLAFGRALKSRSR